MNTNWMNTNGSITSRNVDPDSSTTTEKIRPASDSKVMSPKPSVVIVVSVQYTLVGHEYEAALAIHQLVERGAEHADHHHEHDGEDEHRLLPPPPLGPLRDVLRTVESMLDRWLVDRTKPLAHLRDRHPERLQHDNAPTTITVPMLAQQDLGRHARGMLERPKRSAVIGTRPDRPLPTGSTAVAKKAGSKKREKRTKTEQVARPSAGRAVNRATAVRRRARRARRAGHRSALTMNAAASTSAGVL